MKENGKRRKDRKGRNKEDGGRRGGKYQSETGIQ